MIEKTGTDRPRAEAEGLTSAQAKANVKARAEAHAKEKGKFAGVDTEAVRTAYLTAKAAHQAAKAQTDKLQDNVSQLTGMKSARQKAFNLLHERAQKVRGRRLHLRPCLLACVRSPMASERTLNLAHSPAQSVCRHPLHSTQPHATSPHSPPRPAV